MALGLPPTPDAGITPGPIVDFVTMVLVDGRGILAADLA